MTGYLLLAAALLLIMFITSDNIKIRADREMFYSKGLSRYENFVIPLQRFTHNPDKNKARPTNCLVYIHTENLAFNEGDTIVVIPTRTITNVYRGELKKTIFQMVKHFDIDNLIVFECFGIERSTKDGEKEIIWFDKYLDGSLCWYFSNHNSLHMNKILFHK